MTHDHDIQAFPLPPVVDQYGTVISATPGMTLRDYFAGQALISVTSRSYTGDDAKYYAAKAYEIADAMLEARK